MKKGAYRISNKAIEDLEQIWFYTFEKWSKEQADRYYNLIINEIEYISANPNYGKLISHIKEGYRSTKVKSHLVFYRNSKDSGIEIIRILHERMDIPFHLNQ
jgi:toxin ParE1/3/4